MNNHLHTDGKQVVEAVLFADTHVAAHQAFNIINDTPLDALVAPIRAIDYIMNNGSIVLRNKERVVAGEYIVKHEDESIRKYTAQEFNSMYRKVSPTPPLTSIKDSIMSIQEANQTSVTVGQKYHHKGMTNRPIRAGDLLRVVEVNGTVVEMERCEAHEGLTHDTFGLQLDYLLAHYELSE